MNSFKKPLLYLCVFVWLASTLGPYIIMTLTSLTPQEELISPGARIFPKNPTLAAFRELLSTTPFLQYLTNSLITALSTVAFSLLVASTAAISLSRFRFPGRSSVLTGLLVAQLFPSVLLVISLQSELRSMSLLDSKWGLILIYTTFSFPFATYLLKGFLDSVPRELDEASRIDGCSTVQMVRFVIFPLLRPGLTAAGTYIFIYSWNEFLYSLTFTASDSSRTVPVGLHMFIGDYQIRWDLLTAGGVLAAIPVLVGFMIVQKQLIKGLSAGAVKG
jgi:multiple sugar transport system permease protein